MAARSISRKRPDLAARNRAVRNGVFPYEDAAWLRARYASGLSLRAIAKEADCGLRTIARWMKIHGISSRPALRPPRPRLGRRGHPCSQCGALRTYAASQMRPRCWECHSRRGSANSNWKGKANILSLIRQWTKAHWRDAVLRRDGRCVECGGTEDLQAHHLHRLSPIVKSAIARYHLAVSTAEERAAAAAAIVTDPLIASPENGITLCAACHRLQHVAGSPSRV